MATAQPGQGPLEKDFSNHEIGNGNGNGTGTTGYTNGKSHHLNDANMDSEAALKRIRTASSISISPELFEKLYLSPQNAVKGDLRQTFGNPTPIGLIGFVLCLTPLSCDLMGWRGAGGTGAASIGSYFFFGGVLMLVGGLLEFILGNTYPFVVFMSFGAFWLAFGSSLVPFYNAYGAYSPDPAMPGQGLTTVGFSASFGFFLLFMGLLSFIYLVCALRTNIVFVVIFLSLCPAFVLLAGAYFQLGNAYAAEARKDLHTAASASAYAGRLQIAGGACAFVTSMAGWWIFFAIMLAALDFPFQIPVGDLSTLVKGASDRAKAKDTMV